jgi:hypothetical protein
MISYISKKINSFFVVEFYNRSQEIVLLQVYDRSMSQNSCARTDIMLKRGSRARLKEQQTSSNNNNEQRQQQQQQQQEMPSLPSLPPVPSSAAMMMMGLKQEDRNLSVCLSKKNDDIVFFSTFKFFVLEIILFFG